MADLEKNIKKLFGKKWQITKFEIAGQDLPPSDEETGDYTEFHADHKVKSVNRGRTILSKWKTGSTDNTIILYTETSKETTEMEIVKLSDKTFVFKNINPEGILLTIHMKSASSL